MTSSERARWTSMASIKSYTGPIALCRSCGQPSFTDDEVGHQHFKEQWDGIYCPHYPLAGERISMDWDDMSLEQLRDGYPDTYPHLTSAFGSQS